MNNYFIANFWANVTDFLNHLSQYKNEFDRLEKLRKKFVSDFPISNIKNLTLKQFTEGNNNRYSFCSRLENELKELGDIHGGYINKFGVYFSNIRGQYECTKKWDYNKDYYKALDCLKDEISTLLKAGQNKDYEAIENNRISPLFKGKVLATYFPDDYLPIFSYYYVKNFMDKFLIEYDNTLTFEQNKQQLLQIREYDSRLEKLDNQLLVKFIYTFQEDYLGQKKELKLDIVPIEVSLTYSNCQDINNVKPTTPHKPNYLLAEFKKTEQGNYAEKLVLNFEKNKLQKFGKSILAEKVAQVSKTRGDGLGYDILSFDENGNEIYIEVKSKKCFNNSIDFYLTKTEYEFLDSHPNNAYIYYVYDVYHHPKIHITTLSMIKALGNNWKTPVLYKIALEAQKN